MLIKVAPDPIQRTSTRASPSRSPLSMGKSLQMGPGRGSEVPTPASSAARRSQKKYKRKKMLKGPRTWQKKQKTPPMATAVKSPATAPEQGTNGRKGRENLVDLVEHDLPAIKAERFFRGTSELYGSGCS